MSARLEQSSDGTPVLAIEGEAAAVLARGARSELAQALLAYTIARRWFRSKSRAARRARVADLLPLGGGFVALVEIDYGEGNPETYVLPLELHADEAPAVPAHALIAEIAADGARLGQLCDGLASGPAATALLEAVRGGATARGEAGVLRARAFASFAEVAGTRPLPPRTTALEQTNTTLPLGDRLLLKAYRRLDVGINPELEMGRHLGEAGGARLAPRIVGAVEYERDDGTVAPVAVLQELVANHGTAWDSVLAALDVALRGRGDDSPAAVRALADAFLGPARLLGRRTAELHLALSADASSPAFTLEPLTMDTQRSLAADALAGWARVRGRLRAADPAWPEHTRRLAGELSERDREITRRLEEPLEAPQALSLLRVHGDLHLGQILDVGDDFVFIDFEGEPARPPAQRRAKRCALVDVAGMLRSFSYAAETALRAAAADAADEGRLRPWAWTWTDTVGAGYLDAYTATLGSTTPLLPPRERERGRLLSFFLMEKCLYEVGYELDNRPAWLAIPLEGLRGLLDKETPA